MKTMASLTHPCIGVQRRRGWLALRRFSLTEAASAAAGLGSGVPVAARSCVGKAVAGVQAASGVA